MFIIETSKNPHNRTVFAVIEKFEKPNKYGDIQMIRAVFNTIEKANNYINKKLNK
tara:strand:- start:91 stop:255 length:165 start_codon:yes stop_codon:yes gene_type:complete